jgi:hypothetical protein
LIGKLLLLDFVDLTEKIAAGKLACEKVYLLVNLYVPTDFYKILFLRTPSVSLELCHQCETLWHKLECDNYVA